MNFTAGCSISWDKCKRDTDTGEDLTCIDITITPHLITGHCYVMQVFGNMMFKYANEGLSN